MAATETTQIVSVLEHQVQVAVRPGHGRPLVLCNGIGASLDLLQPFVDELDPAIPVVRFDVPGVGGSPAPRRPYTLPALARLLEDVLDRLGYDEVDVLGISWGGGLAQQFAVQNPRRCHRLVLVSTATGALMIPAHPRVLRKMMTPRRYHDPGYAVEVAASLYGGRLRTEPELARTLLRTHRPSTTGRGYALQLLASAGWTSLPFLKLIRQPTLVLAGDDDPIVPLANARILHRLLPDSTLHIFPDGHLGLITRADLLAPLIARFIRAD